mgnify:CR=1 FL=1
MTSFTAIPSPLQDAAMNQDGENFSNFKILRKKLHLTKKTKTFSQKFLKLCDKYFEIKTRKRVSCTLRGGKISGHAPKSSQITFAAVKLKAQYK